MSQLGSSTKERRLLVCSVRRIIGGFNFREPLHADGVDLGDPVLEGGPFDLILYLAIPKNAFQGDELPLLESLGELREIPRGEDAVPFGACFVFAFIVLPALLGCAIVGSEKNIGSTRSTMSPETSRKLRLFSRDHHLACTITYLAAYSFRPAQAVLKA